MLCVTSMRIQNAWSRKSWVSTLLVHSGFPFSRPASSLPHESTGHELNLIIVNTDLWGYMWAADWRDYSSFLWKALDHCAQWVCSDTETLLMTAAALSIFLISPLHSLLKCYAMLTPPGATFQPCYMHLQCSQAYGGCHASAMLPCIWWPSLAPDVFLSVHAKSSWVVLWSKLLSLQLWLGVLALTFFLEWHGWSFLWHCCCSFISFTSYGLMQMSQNCLISLNKFPSVSPNSGEQSLWFQPTRSVEFASLWEVSERDSCCLLSLLSLLLSGN